MRYTFIMPAYKATNIRESIQSILNQNYKDFNLIISNDCSPENLESIVSEFRDNRIWYRSNDENIGGKNLVAHWNLLLSMVDSDYVILAPDDDIYDASFLSEIDKLVEKYPNIDIFKCRVQRIDEHGEIIQKDRIYEECITSLDNIFHQAMPDHMSGIGNYIFKTKELKAIGGFVYYPLAWWSDVMTSIKMSKNGMVITRDILFTMRLSNISISTRPSSLAEKREKAKATMLCYQDMKQTISELSPLSKYEESRMRIVQEYLIQWLNDDLLISASSYSIKEAYKLLKHHPHVLLNKISRLVFWKRVILSKII